MANGSRPYRHQGQLETDLSAGKAIPYRRLPGTGPRTYGPRTYYNPETGQQVSEDYVVRHYRPALRDQGLAEYAELQTRQRSFNATQSSIRASMLQTFLIKKSSEQGLTLRPNVALNGQVSYSFPRSFVNANQQEFTRLYGELRYYQVTARHAGTVTYNPATGAPIIPREREILLAPDGVYAKTLEELGRRKPNEDFQVGMSPDSRGAYTLNDYITTTVIPFYSGRAA